MIDQHVIDDAKTYLNDQWGAVIEDLAALVAIDSSQDLDSAHAGAPYGDGPRAVLDEAARRMGRYGFSLQDCDGHCGYFDVAGQGGKQLAVIGHLDVVPAGDGWTHDPFALTREGGCLFGRGVIDDKGPLLAAVHALRFWRDRYEREGRSLPVTVRVIFGCAEETGMADADYYLAHHPAPDFLFTPDADFPLCYGEKGHYQARLTSAPIAGGWGVASIKGGTAVNGVPAQAEAMVCFADDPGVDGLQCTPESLPAVEGIRLEMFDCAMAEGAAAHAGMLAGGQCLRVSAQGLSGHAARPEDADNAIGKLVAYLLDNALVAEGQRTWFEFVRSLTGVYDGSGLGIACSDEDFGPLTCVGGVAATRDGRFTQTIDIRFPTSTNLEQLQEALGALASSLGATCETIHEIEPLLVSPESSQVQALRAAYEQVSGCEARLFTMGGGTYAHHFPTGVSFGAVDEDRFPSPAGVGGMHAADEGIAEEALREALLIYIVAFGELFALDWS